MRSMFQDVRVAVRQIGRHRGFSAIVVVTVALGIGATTTFFSLLNGLMFRPLPYGDPDRLVAIHGVEESARQAEFRLGYHTFAEVIQTAEVFESAVAYDTRQYNAGTSMAAERIGATLISGDIFSMLRVPLTLGRPFSAFEHRTSAPVAIVSEAFWTRRYDSDPEVLGSTVVLDGTAHVIVGVAAPRFNFPGSTQIWLPLPPVVDASRDQRVDVAARLRTGVPLDAAAVVLKGAAARRGPEHRVSNADWRPALVPLRQAVLTDKHRYAAGSLLAAAVLVLVVACANLAGLLLAHLAGRRHEVAIRSAIGARRGHVVRLLLTESFVLTVAGGALGVLLAQWGIDLFVGTLGKPRGAEWLEFPIDARVLVFAAVASIATAVLFGVAPALSATRVDLRGVLQDDAQGAATPKGRRLRVALVAAQMALSLGLLAGASSIVASSIAASSLDPGFNRERLLWLRVALAGPRYDHPEQRLAFVDSATATLQSLARVNAVTTVSHLPLTDRNLPHTFYALEGWTPQGQQLPYASLRFASSSYRQVIGLPLRQGRFLSDSEARNPNAPVVVINETMAKRYWPAADAVGRRLRLVGPLGDAWVTVIGVVGDVTQRGPAARPEEQIYVPLPGCRELTFAVRAAGEDAAALVEPARSAVAGIDPTLPITAGTMEQTYAGYASDLRMQASVLGALGAVALALAALGIYAMMTLFVAQQEREIAVRMALGSTGRAMLGLVLRRAASVTVMGLGGGVLLAVCGMTGLSWVFYGLRPFDPVVMAATTLLLAVIALFASWWPARRAMQLDPMVVLRRGPITR